MPARIATFSSDPQISSHAQLRTYSNVFQTATIACKDSAPDLIIHKNPPDFESVFQTAITRFAAVAM